MSETVLALGLSSIDLLLFAGGTLLRHHAAGDDVEVRVESELEPPAVRAAWEKLAQPGPRFFVLHELSALWSGLSPTIVYLPQAPFYCPEAAQLLRMVLAVAREEGGGALQLLAYPTEELLASPVEPFAPHVYVDVTAQAAVKRRGLAGLGEARLQRAEIEAARRGAAAGLSAAEAFTLLFERIAP
ncbi:hypothetical protein HS125_14750 [bacterium]|nr:hypothetical protein [bacterium]